MTMTEPNHDSTVRATDPPAGERLRPYGPATVNRRRTTTVITILAEARDDAGIEEGDEYHMLGDPSAEVVRFVPVANGEAVEPEPGQLDLGRRTVRAYRSDSGSLYISLPPDALAVLGVDAGEDVELQANADGMVEVRPW